jgi:hypothetical protein
MYELCTCSLGLAQYALNSLTLTNSEQGMPKNCSADYEAIIDHIDSVFMQGSDEDKTSLKEMFAVQDLDHDDDAASAIVSISSLPFSGFE